MQSGRQFLLPGDDRFKGGRALPLKEELGDPVGTSYGWSYGVTGHTTVGGKWGGDQEASVNTKSALFDLWQTNG